MGLTAEQQTLVNQINAHVGAIRDGIKRALPGNTGLHEEFRVGAAPATTPAEAVEQGRFIAPLAKEYRTLLIGRGVDGSKLTQLLTSIARLEAIGLGPAPAPAAPAPEAVPEAPAEAEADVAKKKAKGRRT